MLRTRLPAFRCSLTLGSASIRMYPAREVQGDVEGRAARAEGGAEDPVDGVRPTKGLEMAPDQVDRLAVDQIGERKAEKVLSAMSEPSRRVLGGADHHPVGGDGDEEAEGLDRAEDMDRFAVAGVRSTSRSGSG